MPPPPPPAPPPPDLGSVPGAPAPRPSGPQLSLAEQLAQKELRVDRPALEMAEAQEARQIASLGAAEDSVGAALPPVVYVATALHGAGHLFRLEVRVAAGGAPQRLPYYHGDSQFWTVVDAAGESLPYRGPKAKRRAPENVPDGKGWIAVNAGETKILQEQVDLKYFDATGRPRPFTYSVHHQAVQVIPELLREEDASGASAAADQGDSWR